MSPHITASASLGVEDAVVLARASRRTPIYGPCSVPTRPTVYRATTSCALADAVEAYETPSEFAHRYAAFSHWMM
jgi:hypothetical protein